MSDRLQEYLNFINEMNNNYIETIRDKKYNQFIVDIVNDNFEYGPNSKLKFNYNDYKNKINEIKPEIKKEINEIKPQIKKEIDKIKPQIKKEANKINTSVINSSYISGGDGLSLEDLKKLFVTTIDECLTKPEYKIKFNDYNNEENKVYYNNLISLIRKNIIIELIKKYITEIQDYIQNEISETQDKITEKQNSITILRAGIIETQDYITKKQNYIAEIQDEISKTQDKNTEKQNNITILRDEISKTQDKITYNQNYIAEIRDLIIEIQDEIAEKQNHITAIQDYITEIQNYITLSEHDELNSICNKDPKKINKTLHNFSITYINENGYLKRHREDFIETVFKPLLAYLFMYLTTMYLSCNDNFWEYLEYKENFYLFFVLIFELNKHFSNNFLDSLDGNNLSIIPYVTDYKYIRLNDYSKMVPDGACAIIASKKLWYDSIGDEIEKFEYSELDKELHHLMFNLNLESVDKLPSLPEFLSNIVFQFIFFRYTIWMYDSDPLFYDKYFNFIFIKVSKRDNKGKYILDENKHYVKETNHNKKIITLYKNDDNQDNSYIEFKTFDYVAALKLLYDGTLMDFRYNNTGHRIAIRFNPNDKNFTIYDPNYKNYYSTDIKFEELYDDDNNKKYLSLRINLGSEFCRKMKIYYKKSIRIIHIPPIYNTFYYNKNYFVENDVIFNVFNLNTTKNGISIPNVKRDVTFYNYKPTDNSNELTKLTDLAISKINCSLYYLFYDDKTKHFNYYDKERNDPSKDESRYYKKTVNIIDCKNKFLYDEHILVDVNKNKYYFSIIPFELYIDVKDIINQSENFDIYKFNTENGEFKQTSNNNLANLTKIGINPLVKHIKEELNKTIFKTKLDSTTPSKTEGGKINKEIIKTILNIGFILLICFIIAIIIYCIIKVTKKINNNSKT